MGLTNSMGAPVYSFIFFMHQIFVYPKMMHIFVLPEKYTILPKQKQRKCILSWELLKKKKNQFISLK